MTSKQAASSDQSVLTCASKVSPVFVQMSGMTTDDDNRSETILGTKRQRVAVAVAVR